MKSLSIAFIAHDPLFMEMCKNYLTKFDFLKCADVLEVNHFMESHSTEDYPVVIVDLPTSAFQLYEFGIRLKRDFKNASLYAFGHRADFGQILGLQHIQKFFPRVIDRNDHIDVLDKLARQLQQQYQLKSKVLTFIDFTKREKDIISLTCREFTNIEIAYSLEISVRTVETHKSNIYSKLGTNHPSRLFRYALDYDLYLTQLPS